MAKAKAAPKAVSADTEKAQTVEAVLARMAEGETVVEAVKTLKLTVTPGTVRKWMAEREEWLAAYQTAKKLLGNALAEEAIRVARESSSYSSASDRVLIETLKWAAAKANPAEYGEKQTVEHQGAQTLQIKVVEVEGEVRNQQALNQQALNAVMAMESAVLESAVVRALPLKSGEIS
jgi:hypothetical protein